MIYTLDYGQGHRRVHMPDNRSLDVLESPRPPAGGGSDEIARAFREADIKPASFLHSHDRVCIVVSDYTRLTGSEVYVPVLLEQLLNIGIPASNITIVIALGLHRPATREEMRTILGTKVVDAVRVVNHDPDKNLIDVGDTAFNRYVAEADVVILTGVVSFHPMAGYSGGYKSLLPGVASRQAVLDNHRKYFRGLDISPRVGPSLTEGNPVLNDLVRRSSVFGRLYCLNVVLDGAGRIEFAAAGTVSYAWDACRAYVWRYRTATIYRRYDLVIASAGGAPLDYSFYQCMKVLNNASAACIPGGTLVITAQCYAGWEIDSTLFEWFGKPPEEIAETLQQDFRMDGLAVFMAARVIRNHRVFFASSLPDEEVAKTGMIPVNSVDIDLKTLYGESLPQRAAVLPRGSHVLPVSGNNYDGGVQ